MVGFSIMIRYCRPTNSLEPLELQPRHYRWILLQSAKIMHFLFFHRFGNMALRPHFSYQFSNG
jgi:hypothetical protein